MTFLLLGTWCCALCADRPKGMANPAETLHHLEQQQNRPLLQLSSLMLQELAF